MLCLQARLGVPGSRHVYLGLFTEEMEAARAYDAALVRLRGPAAATNFSISDYESDLREYEATTRQGAPLEGAPGTSVGSPTNAWPFQGAHSGCCQPA
jgi:hypothetical protein